MAGLVYFPATGFPEIGWLPRTLLYWRAVTFFMGDNRLPEAQQFDEETGLQRQGWVLKAYHRYVRHSGPAAAGRPAGRVPWLRRGSEPCRRRGNGLGTGSGT